MLKLTTFHHIFGLANSFIQLENRHQWWPLNDHFWQPNPTAELDFHLSPIHFTQEPSSTAQTAMITTIEAVRNQHQEKRLNTALLNELARDLQAEYQTQSLEKLINTINKHLYQDHIFD